MEQGLQKLNADQRLAVWTQRITDCRSSGKGVKHWCQENQNSDGFRWVYDALAAVAHGIHLLTSNPKMFFAPHFLWRSRWSFERTKRKILKFYRKRSSISSNDVFGYNLDKVVVKKESTKEEIHLDIYLKLR